MRSAIIWVAGAALASAGGWMLMSAQSAAAAETFYVDYDRGDDSRDGRTPATAWRHAPGDPAAGGRAGSARLGPGDVLRFAAGVRYRGTVKVDQGGSPAAPLVIEGEGDAGSAIIDGSDPVAGFAPCASAAECGGAPNWQKLTLVRLAEPASWAAGLFTEQGMMRPSQSPDPADAFYRQEPDGFEPTDGNALARGELKLSAREASLMATAGSPALAIWVKPNRVAEVEVTKLEGRIARFDPTGLKFYTDRASAYAVLGTVGLIDQPGEYAWLPGRTAAVAMLPQATRIVSIASGRRGIDLGGRANHVVIRNLGFQNFADDGGDSLGAGVAVFQFAGQAGGLRIENNLFRDMYMRGGQGAIILKHVSDLVIKDNRIERIMLGSGMRLSGPAQRVRVEGNRISRIGRTAIMLMGIEDAVVIRNHISDVKGVHGNGLSAYRANHRVRFIANTVLDAKQPATFHGLEGDPVPNDLVFRNNLFTATPDGFAALISWGRTLGVTIRDNVLVGGEAGLRLTPALENVTIRDNVLSGMVITGDDPQGWTIAGNRYVALSRQQARGRHGGSVDGGVASGVSALLRTGQAQPSLCALVAKDGAGEGGRMIGADIECP